MYRTHRHDAVCGLRLCDNFLRLCDNLMPALSFDEFYRPPSVHKSGPLGSEALLRRRNAMRKALVAGRCPSGRPADVNFGLGFGSSNKRLGA